MSGRDLDEAGLEALTPDAIYALAAERGRAMGLTYAGALTPGEECRLHEAGAARIVDVRTVPEWEFVGRVPDSILVEWRRFHEQGPNRDFLEELAAVCAPQEPILFLCRSGVRSHYAAEVAARAGFMAFNILEGFEGDLDADRQRNTLGGWRAAGLPWEQS